MVKFVLPLIVMSFAIATARANVFDFSEKWEVVTYEDLYNKGIKTGMPLMYVQPGHEGEEGYIAIPAALVNIPTEDYIDGVIKTRIVKEKFCENGVCQIRTTFIYGTPKKIEFIELDESPRFIRGGCPTCR